METKNYLQCTKEFRGKQHGLWLKVSYPNGCPLCAAEVWGSKEWNKKYNKSNKEVMNDK